MPDSSPDALDGRLDAVAQQPFRAKFHLRGRDRATAELNGPATIRRQAGELIAKRLAPAEPSRDGKQTPCRGHPVFVPDARAAFGRFPQHGGSGMGHPRHWCTGR